jgi:hypothetical protein
MRQARMLPRRVRSRIAVAAVFVSFAFLLPSFHPFPGVAHAASESCGDGSSSNGDACMLTPIDSTHFRIDQPFVADAFFEYKGVRFQPGDAITINAGGCVQTGGAGNTWKRYVNPTGDNSGWPDGFYWGSITIPGAIFADNPVINVEHVPLSQAIGHTLLIPKISGPTDFTQPLDLILGYEDDVHDDNSYSDHDDGTDDQCAYANDGDHAWVTISITHGVAAANFPAVNPRPFDLVPQGFDSNFAFKNPVWGWQWKNRPINPDGAYGTCEQGGSTACTAQFTNEDNPGFQFFGVVGDLCGGNPGRGHINWFDAAYTGKIFWESWEEPTFGDDDYNMQLRTPTFKEGTVGGWPAGVTFTNPDSIKLEYDSDETIDYFDSNQWWHDFHHLVEGGNDQGARGMVDDQDAVVIGLVGLDVVHPFGSELHPVHLLAIRETGNQNITTEDTWAIFARNWGDEGECSSQLHYLDRNVVSVDLTPPPGVSSSATPTLVGDNTFHEHNANGLKVNLSPGHVLVAFMLSKPSDEPWEVGELHIDWKSATAAQAQTLPRGPAWAAGATPSRRRDEPNGPVALRYAIWKQIIVRGTAWAADATPVRSRYDEPNGPEAVQHTIWKQMTAQQQQVAKSLQSELLPPVTTQSSTTQPQISTSLLPFPRTPPQVSTAPNPRWRTKLDAKLHALCAATGGNLPTRPSWCPALNYPPITSLRVRSSSNARLVAPATVTLIPQDANGSGIRRTEYRIGRGPWQEYSRPFTLGAGKYTIAYRSSDNHNRLERPRLMTLSIRETP